MSRKRVGRSDCQPKHIYVLFNNRRNYFKSVSAGYRAARASNDSPSRTRTCSPPQRFIRNTQISLGAPIHMLQLYKSFRLVTPAFPSTLHLPTEEQSLQLQIFQDLDFFILFFGFVYLCLYFFI